MSDIGKLSEQARELRRAAWALMQNAKAAAVLLEEQANEIEAQILDDLEIDPEPTSATSVFRWDTTP